MKTTVDPRRHLLYAAIATHLESGRAATVALRSGRRALRYGELAGAVAEGSARIAQALPPRSRVIVAVRDQMQAALGFLATLASGRVPLFADPTSSEGVRRLVARHAVPGLIAEASLLDEVGAPVAIDARDTLEWADGRVRDLVLPAVAADEAAFWTFTSGSTGEPKAVVHGHGGPQAAYRAFALGVVGLGETDRTISTGGLPFVYVLGNGLLFPLFAGASAILPPDLLLPTVLGELERHAATLLVSGPWSLAALVRSAHRDSWVDALGRLRLVLSAGEALPAALFADWRRRFGSAPLDNLGCTEMFNSFLSNAPGEAVAGSLGRVVPGFEIRVDGGAALPGARGALSVRGASRAVAVGGGGGEEDVEPRPVSDGWCETGDFVEVDRDGRLRFLGRADDRLKLRGQFVHPADVERRILACEAVADCMVGAETDEHGLPVLVARVVAAAGDDATTRRAVSRYARRVLLPHEVPGRVDVVASLPRNARGKLIRRRA